MEKKEAFKKIASEREQSELAQGLPGVSGLSKWGLPAAGVIVVLLGLWAYLAFFHATFGIGSTVYLYIDADDTPDSVQVKIKNLSCKTMRVFPDMVSCEDYIFRNLLLRKVK